MGKKKSKSEYNDFLDGEKLRDNAQIRTSLHGPSSVVHDRPAQKGKGSERVGPKKPPLSHFLCLPLVTRASRPQLQDGLESLRKDLVKDGIVSTRAVRPVGSLHLTLGVMSLDEQRMAEADKYLQDLDLYSLFCQVSLRQLAKEAAERGAIAENFNPAAIPDPEPLTVNLESLVPMHAPTKTSILYAEPRDTSQRLYPFAAELRKLFAEQKYMVEDTRALKLHATIINTIYAKPRGGRNTMRNERVQNGPEHIAEGALPHDHHRSERLEERSTIVSTTESVSHGTRTTMAISQNEPSRAQGHGPDAKSWMNFDARSLIETYKDFTWAEGVQIDRVHICKMGAKKVWSGGKEGDGEVIDEVYEVVASKRIFG